MDAPISTSLFSGSIRYFLAAGPMTSRVSRSRLPSVFEISLGVVVAGLVPLIQRLGSLGNPSIDDDEREALSEKTRGSFAFACWPP
jgi:hypothetical protein